MLRSLYSGVSGMRGFQTKLDVIGNNIANVNTSGFKASRVMFRDILSQTVSGVTAPGTDNGGVNAKQIGLGVAAAAIDTIHTPGSAQTTNVVTDLRIDGDGFFGVKANAAQVDPYLTRAGSFNVDAAGNLVNSDGLFVVDTSGAPITIDPTNVVQFSVSQDGTIIKKLNDGTLNSDVKVGVIKVSNPAGLDKIGGNLYRVTPNADNVVAGGGNLTVSTANSTAAGTGAIVSGQLEMSNVDLTAEFTEMIIAQRGFQANSKIITTSDEILQEVVNLKR